MRVGIGRLLADAGTGRTAAGQMITIANGRIAGIEPSAGGGGGLAIPAPIDAHDHGRGLRPIAFGGVDQPLEIWTSGFAAQPAVDPGLVARAAFARLALGGSAGTVHLHRPLDHGRILDEAVLVAGAAREVGIRLAFVVPLVDRNTYAYAEDEGFLAGYDEAERETLRKLLSRPQPSLAEHLALVDAVAQAVGGPMVDVQYGPSGPQWCSDALLEGIADAAARTGRRVHMHLFETRRQREWADAAHGGAPLAFWDRIGLLSPRLTVAHGVWLRPAEITLLAERGVTVATNTSSNLRLRSGLAPLASWKRAGLDFAIGLDGLTFDDDDDMLREIRLAHLLNLGTDLEPAVTPTDMLTAACRIGRRVLDGVADGGRIAAGADADILVLDRDLLTADTVPFDGDDLALLMTRATASHVTDLFVAGRAVVSGGRLTGLDAAAVHRELAAQTRHAAAAREGRRGFIARHQARMRNFYRHGGHTRAASAGR